MMKIIKHRKKELNIRIPLMLTSTINVSNGFGAPELISISYLFHIYYIGLVISVCSFVSSSTASSKNLAFVDPSTNRAIIKVDNTTKVSPGQKRNTVRIATKDQFTIGSVWVADMHHVPYGVSCTSFASANGP